MAAAKALVKPDLLTWTRNRAKVRAEDAAAFYAIADAQGWVLGDATIVVLAQDGEHACTVSTSGYAFDVALAAMKEDGSYEQALKNWGNEAGAIDEFAVNP